MGSPKVVGFVPARMAATRFPGKPLHEILGRPMVEHVFERAKLYPGFDGLFLATCDKEIEDFAKSKGYPVIMTSDKHTRCLDRIAEAADKCGMDVGPDDIVACVQGDEPMLHPDMIKAAIDPLLKNGTPCTVLAMEIAEEEQWRNPDTVKIIHNDRGEVLYTSRAPVPYSKGPFSKELGARRIYGIFAFRQRYLKSFTDMEENRLERLESCDSNRILDGEFRQRIAPFPFRESFSVDSPEDIGRVEAAMKADPALGQLLSMAANRNVVYKSQDLMQYFDGHRDRWDQFYPSERWIFERLCAGGKTLGRVMDVGCALGGLGRALDERALASEYFGLEISPVLAAEGRKRLEERALKIPARIENGDVLSKGPWSEKKFDTVVSLGCADWNIETGRILQGCWDAVRPGGTWIVSLRLSEKEGINDVSKSYQPIVAHGAESNENSERANYVVFNVSESLATLTGLSPRPQRVLGFGNWGAPSKTAVTPYSRLVFAVFAVQKEKSEDAPAFELHFPPDLFVG